MTNLYSFAMFLEGCARRTVGTVDCAATCEPDSGQTPEHGVIVGVCVDADILGQCEAKIDARPQHSVACPVGGKTMNCSVGVAVEPLTIFDNGICWVIALNEGKRHHYFSRRIGPDIDPAAAGTTSSVGRWIAEYVLNHAN